LLAELLPEPEAVGLLALMLLQESRRAARATPEGDLVLLADQDRSLWNREQIADGTALVEGALAAARRALCAAGRDRRRARRGAERRRTDWAQIVALYDVLLRVEPSPVIELNRAVAVAMRDGPEAGLALVDALLDAATSPTTAARTHAGGLVPAHGRADEARAAYAARSSSRSRGRSGASSSAAWPSWDSRRKNLRGRCRKAGPAFD
jgi:RNA polymerase sigma-70 factor (ECF subfamily)